MLTEELKSKIDGFVQEHSVVLFMKGTKVMPQCGFSAQVVQILSEMGTEYTTHNVLADPELREGIKAYSDWPTIPQLYVKGEFQGGCDIVKEMYAKGELHTLLSLEAPSIVEPKLQVSEAAYEQLQAAMQQSTESHLRLEVAPGFKHNLYFGPKQGGDLEVQVRDIKFAIPKMMGAKLDGLSLDYVDGPSGAGFKIENPHAPATVKQMSVAELKQKLDADAGLTVIDVRPEDERSKAKLDFAKAYDDRTKSWLESADKNTPIVFHCHHGGRSQRAADALIKQGFKEVYNLAGGIHAWAQDIDTSVPTY